MSLMLRKKCQALLDDVGLDMYHVQVQETNKYLEIVGECGQVLCTIQGIRLSRAAPNSLEIELALELFDSFLAKHADTFKGFIAAKARADAAKIPRGHEIALTDAYVTKQSYREYWELTFRPLFALGEYEVQSNGTIRVNSFSIDFTAENIKNLEKGLTSHEMSEIFGWLDACREYASATDEKNALKSKLNSCEI